MIRSSKELDNFQLLATDGEIGRVKGLYFDATWNTRYFVVETGSWLASRRVLISTSAADKPKADKHVIPVRLTREQIRNSPPLDISRPVSRHDETTLNNYYGWAPYWDPSGTALLGGMVSPSALDTASPSGALGLGFGTVGGPLVPPPATDADVRADDAGPGDGVVHSTHEAIGYSIEATDGSIGHVEDFLFEDAEWTIQFLVVDTRNWLPGRKVLVAPAWIQGVVWGESRIVVDLSREAIKASPEYDASRPFAAEEAVRLHDYYKTARKP
jgi:hypothetical protein